MLFNKLKKRLTIEIESARKQREAWMKATEEANNRKADADTLIKENEVDREELRNKVTSARIKDVLRTLDHNKLKPLRILVEEGEYNILKNHRDAVKVKDGIAIYEVSIVLDARRKGSFVIDTEKKKKGKK